MTTVSPDNAAQSEQRAQRRQELLDLTEKLTVRMRSWRDPSEWSEVELTMPQFRVLDLLLGGPQRMSDIASSLGTSVQATTSLIDRLTDKGLVERRHDVVDRRVVTCQITDFGRGEVERIYRIGQTRMDLLIDVLDDDELDRVIAAFADLAEAVLRLKPASPAGTADETATAG